LYRGKNLRNRYKDDDDDDNNNNNNNKFFGQIPEMFVIQFEYTLQSNNVAICFVWMT
jgi:hypothetical protein